MRPVFGRRLDDPADHLRHVAEGWDEIVMQVLGAPGDVLLHQRKADALRRAAVDLTVGDYAKTYDYYGTPVTKGVQEIAWTGGNLPDHFYDEFVFRVRVTNFAPGTKIYLPVVQECDSATERWIEIPEPGKSEDDYEHPAPGFTIVAPKDE
jgi:uncharacterized protein YcnI